jgi:PHD/YefM family antitoxin component YafN of YafNO toxin-antitoxin module
MKVTNADFIKNYGALMDKALSEPVTISRNGRDWLVMLSAEEYARLKRRDRRVVRLEEFTEEEMALIAQVAVSAGRSHLDDELKDWRP